MFRIRNSRRLRVKKQCDCKMTSTSKEEYCQGEDNFLLFEAREDDGDCTPEEDEETQQDAFPEGWSNSQENILSEKAVPWWGELLTMASKSDPVRWQVPQLIKMKCKRFCKNHYKQRQDNRSGVPTITKEHGRYSSVEEAVRDLKVVP